MFIAVVLNTQVMSDVYHAYLNMLYYCKKNNWAIISHESYINRPLEYYEAVFIEHDTEKILEKEREEIIQYSIPDAFYETLLNELGSTTNLYLNLFGKRNSALEDTLEQILASIEEKISEEDKLEGFIVFGEAFESLRYIAKRYKIPVITNEFSAIRHSNHYTQTLHYANLEGHLYGSDEGKRRYERFRQENRTIPCFSNKELLALFVRKEDLYLLPMLESAPQYEIGLCDMGARIYPSHFVSQKYTDDDMRKECRALYPAEQISWRQHPGYYQTNSLDMLTAKRDPTSFILSCKRIAAYSSNTFIDAMLWNRVICCKPNTIGLSFACEKDYTSEKKIDKLFLNYFIFAFLVPGHENMYSGEYWRWRLREPLETDIFFKHLDVCLGKLGLDQTIFQMDEEQRLRVILEHRGLKENEIKAVLGKTVQRPYYYAPVSALQVEDTAIDDYRLFCTNRKSENGLEIISEFEIIEKSMPLVAYFYPLYDIAGIIKINEIYYDDVAVPFEETDIADTQFFFAKVNYTVLLKNIPAAIKKIRIVWECRELNSQSLLQYIDDLQQRNILVEQELKNYERSVIKVVADKLKGKIKK